MAAYPSYSILLDSDITPETRYEDDFDQSGGQHSRLFHSSQYYTFKLYHALTLAQFNTLFTTYTSNPRTAVTLTYHNVSPTVTYTVKFTAPPAIVGNYGGDLFKVEARLRGTQN